MKVPTCSVSLHKTGDDDEPVDLDVDIELTCSCGGATSERQQLYKEHDTAHLVCSACGAMFEVLVRTVISFVVEVEQRNKPIVDAAP